MKILILQRIVQFPFSGHINTAQKKMEQIPDRARRRWDHTHWMILAPKGFWEAHVGRMCWLFDIRKTVVILRILFNIKMKQARFTEPLPVILFHLKLWFSIYFTCRSPLIF